MRMTPEIKKYANIATRINIHRPTHIKFFFLAGWRWHRMRRCSMHNIFYLACNFFFSFSYSISCFVCIQRSYCGVGRMRSLSYFYFTSFNRKILSTTNSILKIKSIYHLTQLTSSTMTSLSHIAQQAKKYIFICKRMFIFMTARKWRFLI